MKQTIVQNQTQRLTPQQVLAVRLLELPIDELEQRIHEELESNFALEEGAERPEPTADAECADPANEDYDEGINDDYDGPDASDDDYGNASDDDYDTPGDESLNDREPADDYSDYDDDYTPSSGSSDDDRYTPLSAYKNGTSFRDDLKNQLSLRPLTEEQRFLAEYIVDSLDETGYLTLPLQTLVDGLAFSQNHETTLPAMEEALQIVQDLDPAGIGARNLRECLLLQLREKRASEASTTAYRIINEAFDDFSNKRYERLMSRFNLTREQLEAARHVVLTLLPKPADTSAEHDVEQVKASHTTPDFIVTTGDEGELILRVNNAHIPPIHINQEYAHMLDTLKSDKATNKLKRAENRQGISLIRERIGAAGSFLEALRQRRSTMTAVMKAIVEFQREFFLTGDRSTLRPMVLNDVAKAVGCDISTVSRATGGKYVQTDFGVLAVKQLFTEAMQTADGDSISNAAIQKVLEHCIETEDKKNPLTDERLADLLKEAGYPIARRTVAKYREQLGYSTARLRREV
jgi:RNA polymerase sigma-54 factor